MSEMNALHVNVIKLYQTFICYDDIWKKQHFLCVIDEGNCIQLYKCKSIQKHFCCLKFRMP